MKKTMKTVFAAALVIGSVACKNESADVAKACEQIVAEAQGELDLANARMSELASGKRGVTSEKEDVLENVRRNGIDRTAENLSRVDQQLAEFNVAITNQSILITEAREDLISEILACDTVDQGRASALQEEIVMDQQVIDASLTPDISAGLSALMGVVEAELAELNAEKSSLEGELENLQADTSAVSQTDVADQLEDIADLEELIAEVKAEIQEAEARHASFAKRLDSIEVASN